MIALRFGGHVLPILMAALGLPAAADVNGGCTDELLIGRDGGGSIRWTLRADARAGFSDLTEGGIGWGDARRSTAVGVGDIDADGRDEIIIGRDGAAAQSVRYFVYDDASQGFASLHEGGEDWGAARRVTAIALGDVDGDAALEIAIGRTGPTGFRYRVYDDRLAGFNALFTGGDTWGDDRDVTALAFGDVDGDGLDELVVGRTGGAVQRPRWIVIDDADADFGELATGGGDWGAGRDVTALATGDVDGDGRDEILLGRSSGDNSRWEVHDDAGAGFATINSGGDGWGSGRGVTAVAMGDVDGDTLAELVVGRDAGSGPRAFVFDDMQDGWRVLHRIGESWGVTRGVRTLATGDPDGDRADEIAVGRNGGANERWFVFNDRLQGFARMAGGGGSWGVGRAVTAMAMRAGPPARSDRDGDGLLDEWETLGIDADCDGSIDFLPPDADPDRMNVYVELDYMQNHEPDPDALQDVVDAFAAAPTPNPVGPTGIDLRIDLDEEIPEILDVGTWDGFDAIRDDRFGTVLERDLSNAEAILDAKSWVYRYALMGHTRDGGTSSGRAKRGNFFVTLGGSPWAQDASGHNVGSRVQQAGTIMHELGHTLGLAHGGTDGTNCKPNYLSVMNYSFQTRLIPNPSAPGPRLDYSRRALPDLDETALSEAAGIQDGTDSTFWGDDGTTRYVAPGTGAIDWDSDGMIDGGTVPADVNFTPTNACGASPGQTLAGADDWGGLSLATRTMSGAPADEDAFPDEELTGEDAVRLEACAEGEDTARCTRPPYEYAAKFVCGVQDDPATLRLVRGVYGSVVNVHNPWDRDAPFYKKVAVAYPPAAQRAGDIRFMGKDLLRYDEALKVDCEDIRARAFGGAFPTGVVEGFVVIQSFDSLDVTAVLTTGALGAGGSCCGGAGGIAHSSIEVVPVAERVKTRIPPPVEEQANLVPEPAFPAPGPGLPEGLPQTLYCGDNGPAGGAARSVEAIARNVGAAPAGASTARVSFASGEVVEIAVTPLLADGGAPLSVEIPPGCYGPGFSGRCDFEIVVDVADAVAESDEGDNSVAAHCIGPAG